MFGTILNFLSNCKGNFLKNFIYIIFTSILTTITYYYAYGIGEKDASYSCLADSQRKNNEIEKNMRRYKKSLDYKYKVAIDEIQKGLDTNNFLHSSCSDTSVLQCKTK